MKYHSIKFQHKVLPGIRKLFEQSNPNVKINHGITEWLRLEGTSGNHPVQPPSKQGHLTHVAQDLIQVCSEYLQGRRLHILFDQPVPVLCHAYSKEMLSHIQPSCASVVPIASCPVAGHH